MSTGLQSFLTRPALDQTILPLGIIRAPAAIVAAVVAAAVVTGDHADPSPPGIAAIDHGPVKGINPVTKVGLDPQGGPPVIDPVLLITNVPSVPRGLLTGNDVKRV